MRQKSRVCRRIYRPRDDARADLFDYIEVFYNRQIKHSTLGYKSPLAIDEVNCVSIFSGGDHISFLSEFIKREQFLMGIIDA